MGIRPEGAVGAIIRPAFAHKVRMTAISLITNSFLYWNMDRWYSL